MHGRTGKGRVTDRHHACVRAAADYPVSRRVVAYLAVLGGYFFYCYNFLVTGYVRPELIEFYGHTLRQTADITVAQNVGVTAGSVCAAMIVARIGKRYSIAIIAIGSGALTVANIYFTQPWSWMLARGAIAFFLGGYYVAAVTLMVALFPQRYRAKLQALNSGMFSAAEIVLGAIGAMAAEAHWLTLLWFGGLPPILLGLLIFAAVPDDRRMIGYGEVSNGSAAAASDAKSGWAEMFAPRFRRFTITCILLAGSNFTGYQLFSEFLTLYLRQVRAFDAQQVGIAFSLVGVGSLLGGFFWAFVSDRYGRRVPALGFVGAALLIVAYLVAPTSTRIIQLAGFLYGVCLSCSYSWGVYFSEIFPARLRPYGAALYHGGHIVSLLAPLAVATVANRYGIAAAMGLAPIVFLAGAALWASLPETLRKERFELEWNPEARLEEVVAGAGPRSV